MDQFGCSRFVAGLLAAALLLCASKVDGQVLQGQWVDETEAAIQEHRMTDVTVIVLDREDRPIQGAQVRLDQQRHDFLIGLTLPEDRLPPETVEGRAVYRCLNAIALDRLTDWSNPEPASSQTAERVIAAWTEAIDPVHTAFGRVISADPLHNQDEASLLQPADLRDVVLARIDYAMGLSANPDSYDLYADLLTQDMIERKLGTGMVHRMFEHALASRQDAGLSLRVRDAITINRGRDLLAAVQRLEVLQIPFDNLTIEQRFTGQVNPNPLGRMLDDYVASLPVPVTMAGFEVGGPTQITAGLNMEKVLRVLFAQPNVRGIFFSGLYPSQVTEEHAALMDEQGEPTAPGMVLDAMFAEHWRTDECASSDDRGNVQTRVFTGWYEVTATLPNGQTIRTEAYIPKSDRVRLIVLQQTAAEQPSP